MGVCALGGVFILAIPVGSAVIGVGGVMGLGVVFASPAGPRRSGWADQPGYGQALLALFTSEVDQAGTAVAASGSEGAGGGVIICAILTAATHRATARGTSGRAPQLSCAFRGAGGSSGEVKIKPVNSNPTMRNTLPRACGHSGLEF